jgi:5-methylcytosine-specific restriction endonuclease McrA
MNTTNLIWITPDAEKFIAEIARVSNPANQKNPKYDGLIKYLIKNNHWSPFEMAAACFEINTSRRIAPQILRHRSFTFQEFCITGDSLITTVLPSSGLPSYIPIESLYKKQNWKNYKNIKLRVYDNDKLEFTTANFNEIVFNGNKKVFRVTLSDGKTIKCTEKHKFLTPDNEYVPLDELVGMEVTKNNIVTMKYKKFIAVNGEPSYRNFDWLSKQRNENPILSVQTIADRANCSYHTIRKWLKIHKLNFSPLEISKISPVWNKGKFGYSTSLVVTEKHKEAIRKARSKEKSNWWKGGVERSERQKIADWTQKIRKQKLLDFNFTCNNCKIRGGKLELDHVKAVYSNPELAYEYDNIQVLCKSCHDLKHHLNGDTKKWRTISKGNTLTTKYHILE